jgi:hypothetical protein
VRRAGAARQWPLDPPPPLETTDRSRYVQLTTLEDGQRP